MMKREKNRANCSSGIPLFLAIGTCRSLGLTMLDVSRHGALGDVMQLLLYLVKVVTVFQ
jgi:hypothetical protein